MLDSDANLLASICGEVRPWKVEILTLPAGLGEQYTCPGPPLDRPSGARFLLLPAMEYFAKPQASSAVKIVKPEGGDVQLPPFTKPPKKGASNAVRSWVRTVVNSELVKPLI